MRMLIGVLFVVSVVAQSNTVPVPTRVVRTGVFSVGMGQTITGQPYSARELTEQVQTLGDGTRITQPVQETLIYRDSQGRTRTERMIQVPAGVPGRISVPAIVEINDPVSGNHYYLNQGDHTAQLMTTAPPPPPPAGSTSRQVTASLTTTPPVWFTPSATMPQQKTQFSQESLGSRTIEGVLAEGVRTTSVFPAGSIGNDRPITVTTEVWTSPELNVTVLRKNSDPRTGDLTVTLTNISRAEPSLSLFQVPADYQINSANR